MKFWDTSAIISLCAKEPTHGEVVRISEEDPTITVWWGTRVECIAAIVRKVREGSLDLESEDQVRSELSFLVKDWHEVQPSEMVRTIAEKVLSYHALRTADAFQLAASLVWAQEDPQESGFVSFDRRLRDAARKEGFAALPDAI